MPSLKATALVLLGMVMLQVCGGANLRGNTEPAVKYTEAVAFDIITRFVTHEAKTGITKEEFKNAVYMTKKMGVQMDVVSFAASSKSTSAALGSSLHSMYLEYYKNKKQFDIRPGRWRSTSLTVSSRTRPRRGPPRAHAAGNPGFGHHLRRRLCHPRL